MKYVLIILVFIFISNALSAQSRYPHKIILKSEYGGYVYKAKIIDIKDGIIICWVKNYGYKEIKLSTVSEICEIPQRPNSLSISGIIGQIGIVEKPSLGSFGIKLSWEPHPNWSFGAYVRYEYYYRYFLNNPDTSYNNLNVVSPLFEIRWYPWYNSHKVKFGFFSDVGFAFSSVNHDPVNVHRYGWVGIAGICFKTYLSERLLLNSDAGFRFQFPEDPYKKPIKNDLSNSHGGEFRLGISYRFHTYPK